ncbi:MAG: hypothetical protein HQL82_16840 [Magnetococcales bacterium]|nr:hypothetical protein [Magnetococcales bacterium]
MIFGQRWAKNPGRLAGWLFLLLFAPLALWINRGTIGLPVYKVMRIIDPAVFHDPQAFWNLLIDFRYPLSPLHMVWEFLVVGVFGAVPDYHISFQLFTLGAFGMAISLSAHSVFETLLATVLALILLYCTRLLTPDGTIIYEISHIFFMVGYLFCLAHFSRTVSGRGRAAWILLAGLALALADLTRVFFMIQLPFVLFGTWFFLRLCQVTRRELLLLLLPLLLLAGPWHLNHWLRLDMPVWSNHGGYNMWRAWYHAIETPAFLPEGHATIGPGINTVAHGRNSAMLEEALQRYWLEHPGPSLRHAVHAINYKFGIPTTIERPVQSTHDLLIYYRFIVQVLFVTFFLHFLRRTCKLHRLCHWQPQTWLEMIAHGFVVTTFLAISLFEYGYDGIYIVQILPLLVYLPRGWPDTLRRDLYALTPHPVADRRPGS